MKNLKEYLNESLITESSKMYTLFCYCDTPGDIDDLRDQLDPYFDYCEVDEESWDEGTIQVHVTSTPRDIKRTANILDCISDYEEE